MSEINNPADTLNAPFTFNGSPFTINSAVIDIGTSGSATTMSGSITLPTLSSGTSANILYYNSGVITYGAAPIVSPAWLLNGMNTGGAGAYLLGTSDASDGWGMQSAGTQFFTVSASQAVTFTTSSISIVSPIINIGNTGTPAIQIGNLNSGTSLVLKGDTVLTDGHTSWACDSPTITVGATAARSINISNAACVTTLDGTTLKIPNLPSTTTSDVIFYNSSNGVLSFGATPTGPAGWLTNGSNTGAGLLLGNTDGNSWSMQSNSTVFFTVDSAQNIVETNYTYTLTTEKGVSFTSNTSGIAFSAGDAFFISAGALFTASALGFTFSPYTSGFAINGSITSGSFSVSMPNGSADIYGYSASTITSGVSYTLDAPTVNIGTSAATSISLGSSISTVLLPSLASGISSNVILYNSSTGQIFYGAASSVSANWINVTATSQAISTNTQYISNASTLLTFTLPTTAAQGTYFAIAGNGAGNWKIGQNAAQNIQVGNESTTVGTGGSVASTNQYDCIYCLCTVANTTFVVLNSFGSLTVT